MNNKVNNKELENVEDSNVRTLNRGTLLRIIEYVLLFTVLVVGYHLWKSQKDTRANLEIISNNNKINIDSAEVRIKDIETSLLQLRDNQTAITDSLTALFDQYPVNNLDWALNEVEYLLIIATHRLLLEQDVNTALSAMKAAGLRLRDLGDPNLIPVREQLADDVNKLQSIHLVDISGMAIYIADLISRSNDLPLKTDTIKINSEENIDKNEGNKNTSWRDLPSLIWAEIKSLLIIKRTGETARPLLSSKEEYFLYHNLRLELESARLSVLRRDTENMRISIHILIDWLNEYFDTNTAAVVNIIDTLKQMSSVELNPELPSINSSLESVRAFIRGAGQD